MKPAPKQIDGANVICFAVIDSKVQPTGDCKQIVSGILQESASSLAICHYENDEGFYLFGCNNQWHCVTDTWHETLEDAKHQAEFEYAGISDFWEQKEVPN